MGFTPTFDTLDTPDSVLDHTADMLQRGGTRIAHDVLRFGGLAFDSRNGMASWRGKTLTLPVREREALSVLMRRAGQILSRQSLASLLGVAADRLDDRMQALRHQLKSAGVTCLPVHVDGLGYVLWRC